MIKTLTLILNLLLCARFQTSAVTYDPKALDKAIQDITRMLLHLEE